MKKVFIHIGIGKTGTTSIQASLHSEARNKSCSFMYPLTGRYRVAHHYLYPLNVPKGPPYTRKPIKLYYRLKKEIDECMKDAIIISTENLSFANHARIKLLSEATAKYRVTIILYVRDQPSILLSAYLQWIRMLKIPVYEQLIDFIENHASSFDYRSILSKYEQAFGVDNIIVRHYRKDLLKSGDVVVDFASLCNIELSSECHVSTNRSLSLQVLPLALLINKLDIPKTQKQSLMSSLGELSDTLPFQSAKPMIDVKMHDWILNRFSESNEYICSTYGINLNAS